MIANKDKRGIFSRLRGMFATTNAYDAAAPNNKRQAPATSTLKSTDDLLPDSKRRQLLASANDLQRNFSLAAWAIRRHLDYVSSFNFQADTGSPDLNRRVEQFVDRWSMASNFDAAGRHTLSRSVRLSEGRRVVDGDVLLVKLDRGLVQAIEGDRIRDPRESVSRRGMPQGTLRPPPGNWVHGFDVGPGGRVLRAAIHKRPEKGAGTYTLERVVRARNFLQLGYYERFDQVRGVSPMASAINSFRDQYEMIDLALAKAKVSQLFALAFYREMGDDFGETPDGSGGYDVDFGKGPVKLELDPGDRAEFLESKSPPTELQQFSQLVTAIALKSLDIPFSFADESFTNFFGSRAAFVHYEKACKGKRADLREMLDHLTAWRLAIGLRDGDPLLRGLTLDRKAGEWIADGTPWWNPQQEITADIAAIEAGLNTRSRICRERLGVDFHDVVDTLAEEEAYIVEKGVTIGTSVAGAVAGRPTNGD